MTPAGRRRAPSGRVWIAAPVLALALAWPAARALGQGESRVAGPPSAAVRQIDGTPYVGANDLARLLDGAKYWRADVRKLVVRAQGHRFTFTADNPIVVLDDRVVRLSAPVRSVGGELQVPLELVPLLPRDSSAARLSVDAGSTRVRLVPPGGFVGSPRIAEASGETRITLAGEGAALAAVTGRDRRHLRLRLPGVFAGTLPDSLDPGSLLRGVRRLGGGDGVTLEFDVAPEAAGWRLESQPGRAVLVLARSGAGLEPFAPESAPGPRAMRVVVLDPGHGGADSGVTAEGAVEKDLALALARRVASELERRGVRAVLTRADDRAVPVAERAETANRARADVVVALHFDGFPSPRARGATAWVPAADVGDGGVLAAMTPWRDVASRHATTARSLAEDLATAFEARALGPARVRERLALPLLGVNAPGVVLECATLTHPDDRARAVSESGQQELALAIVEGLLAWQRHE